VGRTDPSDRGSTMKSGTKSYQWVWCKHCGKEEYSRFYSHWVKRLTYIENWRNCPVCQSKETIVYGWDNGDVPIIEEEE
jgi:Zn finger protein HypA/HybF involved in hydrogenase expression